MKVHVGKGLYAAQAHPNPNPNPNPNEVTFAPDARALAAKYRALVEGGNDWQAAARASARRFRDRFQPVDIFRRAGVYARFGLAVQD